MTNPAPTWRKASYSTNTANCVELADAGTEILVRDSKHPDQGHVTLTRADLATFLTSIKAGEFDHLSA